MTGTTTKLKALNLVIISFRVNSNIYNLIKLQIVKLKRD